jgi:hypothetical protein
MGIDVPASVNYVPSTWAFAAVGIVVTEISSRS